jgi:hypothetical protein
MNETKAAAKQRLLDNADATKAKTVVDIVAPALDRFADQVWCFGIPNTSDERRALGMVAQMAAELTLGAAAMFEAGKAYAGASLVRQLIEADYLLFLFGQDSGEAARWFNGTVEQHKRLFQPAAMRKRSLGRFDVDEYDRHCEMGGHPRPAARALVDRHHLTTTDPSALLWGDLANHVVRLWGHYKTAAVSCSPTNVYPERWQPLDTACEAWWEDSRELQVLVAEIRGPRE